MNRATYTLLLRVFAPVIWAAMAWSARRSRTHWAVLSRERFGYDSDREVQRDCSIASKHADASSTDVPVWVHAVSVGETRAAQPLIRALLEQGDTVLLTHTTPTGRQAGQTLYAEALAQGRLRQAWMPYDFPGACRRFLNAHTPRLAVLIEREVWPNMVAACNRGNVPIALVSARLSERGAKRSARLGQVLRQAYAGLDIVCAQSADDAGRLREAGARRVQISGNLKFDVVLDADQLARGRAWRQALARPVILLASTREGEDGPFAQAIRQCLTQTGADAIATEPATATSVAGGRGADRNSAVMASAGDAARADVHKLAGAAAGEVQPLIIWVPRHAQRFDEVAEALDEAGLVSVRRSASSGPPTPATQVYLGDTLGEMAVYLGAANVAIIGGSFAPLGAQNFIEACAAGVPVILGPSVYNFQDAARDALAHGLVRQVGEAAQALDLAWRLCADPQEQAAFAPRAQAWMATHVGATQRIQAAMASVASK